MNIPFKFRQNKEIAWEDIPVSYQLTIDNQTDALILASEKARHFLKEFKEVSFELDSFIYRCIHIRAEIRYLPDEEGIWVVVPGHDTTFDGKYAGRNSVEALQSFIEKLHHRDYLGIIHASIRF